MGCFSLRPLEDGLAVVAGTGKPSDLSMSSDISVAVATSSISLTFHVERISKLELELKIWSTDR